MAKEDMVRESMYDNMEERMKMRKAIGERLGDNLTPETYMEFCAKHCIEIPIISAAFAWRP